MRTLVLLFLSAAVAWPQSCTPSSPLVIDDFMTGKHKANLKAGVDNDVQTGSMVGGRRRTTFFVGPPLTANPLNRTGTFEINLHDPLLVEMGVKANWGLTIFYGATLTALFPMNLDLSGYDRFRLTVDSADLGPLLIMNIYTGGLTTFSPRSGP